MNSSALPLGLQLSYLLLYALGVVGGLWQRGHAVMCLSVLASLLPLGLIARIPEKWFPEWMRQSCQLILAGCGMAWWQYRLGKTAIDLMLVEGTVVLGLALIVGGIRREYATLSTISLLFLGYGGVAPGRAVYVPVFFLYCFLGILMMYQTRTLRLLDSEPESSAPTPKGSAWFHRALHFIFVGTFLFVFVTTCPMPKGSSTGVVPVSFRSSQELQFPSLWKYWFQPAKTVLITNSGKTETDDGENPTVSSKKAKKKAKSKQPDQLDSHEGKGGAGVGTDLVYRVYSPAKLYWLMRLYDTYDGGKWTVSGTMDRAKGGLDTVHFKSGEKLDQHFSVEKSVSRYVAGAYRAQRFTYRPPPGSMGATGGKAAPKHLILRHHIAGALMKDDPPNPPWGYTCHSIIPTVDATINVAPWESFKRRGWNYRQLPVDKISQRLRDLAKDLTAGCDTSMQKATVLRDFLRANYAYTLTPPPIPDDAEVVDYFLFESKQGYCQHFAQALTVIARLAGLQARLATGYSPGNYNLLSKCFEVYEYHAHAWTQIFIEPFGWLTFDGSPPGELRLETTPAFLRHLGDPFGDEWASHPPELGISKPAPKKAPAEDRPPVDQPKDGNVISRAYQEVYNSAVLESGSLEPTAKDLLKAFVREFKAWVGNLWKKLKTGGVSWLTGIWNSFVFSLAAALAWMQSQPASYYAVMLIIACVLVLVYRRRGVFRKWMHRWYQKRQCARLWRQLQRADLSEPETVVRHSFAFSSFMLGMIGCRRKGNLDLLEFSDCLITSDAELGNPVHDIFAPFAVLVFSNEGINREVAASTRVACEILRKTILKRLSSAKG